MYVDKSMGRFKCPKLVPMKLSVNREQKGEFQKGGAHGCYAVPMPPQEFSLLGGLFSEDVLGET